MKAIIHSLTLVGFLLGLSFLLCAGIGFVYHDPSNVTTSFLLMGFGCLAGSFTAWFFTRHHPELDRRDAIVLVLSSWFLCGIIGAIPYLILGISNDPASALFESFSGFTTTGASVLSNLESLPQAVLFWRSFTHFLGGVGILILFIAILPFVGAGGVRLYKTEATGLFSEKLTVRVAGTARIILSIYLLLNILCAIVLRIGGLSWFDAVCHAFATIATGGFSTRSESIGAFQHPFIEWAIIFFMFISGMSFIAHYRALSGNPKCYFKSSEIRFYAFLCGGAILLSTALLLPNFDETVPNVLRDAAFQTVSLFSTTGFTTADYDPWPETIKVLFLILMMFGACAGSTSGAIKSVRIVVLGKVMARQIGTILHRSKVQMIKIDGSAVDNERVDRALSYVVVYLMILAVAILFISAFTPDILTAASAAIACLGGVGPGMSGAGPTETYAHFPAIAKLFLILCMLLGRLEIYICLVVLTPTFWKR